MYAIRSALATLLWASPASSVLLSGAARPLASCRVAAPVCLAEQVEDAVAEEVTKARALAGLQSQAVQWLAMSSAISLSDGEGLQPFAVPQGWMAAPSAPPAQSFTNDELSAEIERREPALLALLKACAERAPSLCTPSACSAVQQKRIRFIFARTSSDPNAFRVCSGRGDGDVGDVGDAPPSPSPWSRVPDAPPFGIAARASS